MDMRVYEFLILSTLFRNVINLSNFICKAKNKEQKYHDGEEGTSNEGKRYKVYKRSKNKRAPLIYDHVIALQR
jgi:hypothetical protein